MVPGIKHAQFAVQLNVYVRVARRTVPVFNVRSTAVHIENEIILMGPEIKSYWNDRRLKFYYGCQLQNETRN